MFCRTFFCQGGSSMLASGTEQPMNGTFSDCKGVLMPRAVPVPVRQAIWRCHQNGQSAASIAAALRLSERTVRALLQRFDRQGSGSLSPSYELCGSGSSSVPSPLVQLALRLRQEHPTWGAGFLRVVLHDSYPDAALPSERTLVRWLAREQQVPAPPGRRPAVASDRAR